MGAWKERERTVWSCRLCALPEEDEAAGLEEELRARRLGFVEDARALRQYIQATGCSQEECARRLGPHPAGRSPTACVFCACRRTSWPSSPAAPLRNAMAAPCFVWSRRPCSGWPWTGSSGTGCPWRRQRATWTAWAAPRNTPRCAALKDAGIFLQSLQRDLETLRRYGIRVREERRETDTELVLIVHIEKRDCEGGGAVAL